MQIALLHFAIRQLIRRSETMNREILYHWPPLLRRFIRFSFFHGFRLDEYTVCSVHVLWTTLTCDFFVLPGISIVRTSNDPIF